MRLARAVPILVVEVAEFIRRSSALLDEEERLQLIADLAEDPERGPIMEGTGGVRKLRWAPEGQGRSGAYRVIYFFHSDMLPIFLLTLYAKGEKDNVSKAEKNEMRKLIPRLVKTYIEGRERMLTASGRGPHREQTKERPHSNDRGRAKHPTRAE